MEALTATFKLKPLVREGNLWMLMGTGHRSLLMRMRIACSIDEVISM